LRGCLFGVVGKLPVSVMRNVADPNGTFNIGKRNALAAKKVLWQFGLGAVAEDVGGSHSRTVTLYHDTGRIVLSCPGRPDWEL
jgi:chemotaxis protein CheD